MPRDLSIALTQSNITGRLETAWGKKMGSLEEQLCCFILKMALKIFLHSLSMNKGIGILSFDYNSPGAPGEYSVQYESTFNT